MMKRRLRAILSALAGLTFTQLIGTQAHATNWVLALAAKATDGAKDAITELVRGSTESLGQATRWSSTTRPIRAKSRR